MDEHDEIQMALKATCFEGQRRAGSSQDRVPWQALVQTALNLRILLKLLVISIVQGGKR